MGPGSLEMAGKFPYLRVVHHGLCHDWRHLELTFGRHRFCKPAVLGSAKGSAGDVMVFDGADDQSTRYNFFCRAKGQARAGGDVATVNGVGWN